MHGSVNRAGSSSARLCAGPPRDAGTFGARRKTGDISKVAPTEFQGSPASIAAMPTRSQVLERRVAAGAAGVLLVLLVGAHADAFLVRRHIDHLVDEQAREGALLAEAKVAVAGARADQAAADGQVESARETLARAFELLAGAGLERQTLAEDERSVGEWLSGVDQRREETQRQTEELATDVTDAERCIDVGMNLLTNATAGGGVDSQDPSCQGAGRGDSTSGASPAR